MFASLMSDMPGSVDPFGSGGLSRPGMSLSPLYAMSLAASDFAAGASEYETGGLRGFFGLEYARSAGHDFLLRRRPDRCLATGMCLTRMS
jgi:hypothetical protein